MKNASKDLLIDELVINKEDIKNLEHAKFELMNNFEIDEDTKQKQMKAYDEQIAKRNQANYKVIDDYIEFVSKNN